MTNNVTADPKIIHTIIVIARGLHIGSQTIEINHKNVVNVVNIIGCNLALPASLMASVLFIHFSILLLVLSIKTIASFTIIPVRAINHIPNIRL